VDAETPLAAQDRSGAVVTALHAGYAATGDDRLRETLLAHYDPLAVRLARGFRSRREEAADLIQVARIGLILALDRFDPAQERPFSAFARATITGELKRHLRDRTWPIHVPRTLKEHYLAVCQVADDLTQQLQRSPHANEIAAHAGLRESEVREVMILLYSTDFRGPEALGFGDCTAIEDPAFGRFENQRTVATMLTTLPPADRETLRLRFELGLSQADIANRLGVSQMAVSRRLQRSLGQLRRRLSGEAENVSSRKADDGCR
jgi:RNA polymerase sigma-B factor